MNTRIGSGLQKLSPNDCKSCFDKKFQEHFNDYSENLVYKKLTEITKRILKRHENIPTISIHKFSIDVCAGIRVDYKNDPKTKNSLIILVQNLFSPRKPIIPEVNHQRLRSAPNFNQRRGNAHSNNRSSDISALQRTYTEKRDDFFDFSINKNRDKSGEESKDNRSVVSRTLTEKYPSSHTTKSSSKHNRSGSHPPSKNQKLPANLKI